MKDEILKNLIIGAIILVVIFGVFFVIWVFGYLLSLLNGGC